MFNQAREWLLWSCTRTSRERRRGLPAQWLLSCRRYETMFSRTAGTLRTKPRFQGHRNGIIFTKELESDINNHESVLSSWMADNKHLETIDLKTKISLPIFIYLDFATLYNLIC
jgi:hypothetical protein